MNDRNLNSGPSVCDTTIAEHVANEAHGSRYGVDWIWHDDRLGYLLTKPSKVKPTPPAGARDAVTDEMVERAALAIFQKTFCYSGTDMEIPKKHWENNAHSYRRDARIALEAALASKADGGRFLTNDQVQAIKDAAYRDGYERRHLEVLGALV